MVVLRSVLFSLRYAAAGAWSWCFAVDAPAWAVWVWRVLAPVVVSPIPAWRFRGRAARGWHFRAWGRWRRSFAVPGAVLRPRSSAHFLRLGAWLRRARAGSSRPFRG